jgi:hypothetical protein
VVGAVLLGHALVDRAVLVYQVVGAGDALRVAESDGAGPTSPWDEIDTLVLEFPGNGYRRVGKALQRDGWTVNHERV